MKKKIIPTILTYHGKILAACGDTSDIFPPAGHYLWENFNTFAENLYFRRRGSCAVIPTVWGGREILLFFDTFSPDVAPNMQLFFDESVSDLAADSKVPLFLYEELRRAGLSPAVSEEIFLEKYNRILTAASFFNEDFSRNSIRRINLREILKKAADLYSTRNPDFKEPEIHIMPQITDTAEALTSPIAFCAVTLLALSILCADPAERSEVSLRISKRDELFEISLYHDLPQGESVVYNTSRAGLCSIFPDRSNEAVLLFRIADASRLSVSYGAEGDRFYLTVSFKAHTLSPSFKAKAFSETEEKILSVLADFLI